MHTKTSAAVFYYMSELVKTITYIWK